jgi:galactokinase
VTAAGLAEAFYSRYQKPARIFYAPGRVNLIGEHTDYNDGFVMPFALDRGTCVAGARREDRRMRVHSNTLNATAEFDLDNPGPLKRGIWVDYVEGMARALELSGARLSGTDLLIDSSLPTGAGLSSSAALEISTGKALAALSGHALGGMDLVKLAHRTEHEYVGTQSGIMDQYIATFGKRGHCLLIDCRSLDSKAIPLETTDIALIVIDTAIKHDLASTAYNQRREECAEGVRLLAVRFPDVQALRDVSLAKLQQGAMLLPPVIFQRCRHVVSEIQRTLDAADALLRRDFIRVGALMFKSHRSLQYDYQVTIPELDFLVDMAEHTDGVLGSRMTGGGFGGCTITLVRREAVDAFVAAAQLGYKKQFDVTPRVMEAKPSEGSVELELK